MRVSIAISSPSSIKQGRDRGRRRPSHGLECAVAAVGVAARVLSGAGEPSGRSRRSRSSASSLSCVQQVARTRQRRACQKRELAPSGNATPSPRDPAGWPAARFLGAERHRSGRRTVPFSKRRSARTPRAGRAQSLARQHTLRNSGLVTPATTLWKSGLRSGLSPRCA